MEKYINSFFEKQTETPMKELLNLYSSEQGLLSSPDINKILQDEQPYCGRDVWENPIYSRAQIKAMLTKLEE
jgi:hypothetical protein